ncbi:MAG: hypothetical protein NTY53_12710 [Kiritimatiellaeota bacterium]|nr:hypothetical protein [Kiritimatiellota bacterium]
MNDNNPLLESACGNVRLQRWLLRIGGLGQPPQSALLLYFGAGGSFVYVALGVLFWLFSNDIVRYRPLVLASAWLSLLGSPAFLWIDWQCGLPTWWIAMDSISCLLFGVALLWACHVRERGNRKN